MYVRITNGEIPLMAVMLSPDTKNLRFGGFFCQRQKEFLEYNKYLYM